MLSLLSPRFLIGLALSIAFALSNGFSYKAGRAAVRVDWDKEKILQLNNAKDAENENRKIESTRSRNVIEAQNARVKREITLKNDADRARDESVSLRDDITSLRLQLPSLTRTAINKYADTASIVFEDCQRSYQELAGHADGHANDALMYQQAWPTVN